MLCVDRSRYGGDTVSTHALMRGGVLQLQRWGVLDAVADAGTPPVRRTVFHYGAESVAVSIRPSAGVDALYAPRRTVIDALLVDAAQRAGATVEFGATVAGLQRDSDGRVTGVVIDDRRAAIDRGSRRVERAPLVVGADGRNSLVARATGAARGPAGRRASSFLYGYWADFPSDGYEWFYRPGLTAGAIPTNAGLTCVFVGAQPARIEELVSARSPLAAFQLLADPAGIGSRIRAAARAEPVRYVRALPPGYLRPAFGPGWALVGDAGHWIDPISTHGMTAALRDAELLSQAVLSAPQGGAQLAVRARRIPGHPRPAVPADAAGDRGNRLLPVGSHPHPDVAAHPVLGDDGRGGSTHRAGPGGLTDVRERPDDSVDVTTIIRGREAIEPWMSASPCWVVSRWRSPGRRSRRRSGGGGMPRRW